jgi:hypothetical protein
MIADVLVERDLLRAVPAPPPPLPVARLVDDNAVDPGAKGRLPPEPGKGAEHAEEHFLRQVERLVVIGEQVQGELVHHTLMLGDELRAGVLVAGGAALYQRRLAPADLRPGDGWNWLHGQSFCHFSTPFPGESDRLITVRTPCPPKGSNSGRIL